MRLCMHPENNWLSVYHKEQQQLYGQITLLKAKRNLLYIRNQSVPRCKHFPPRLFKDQT